MKRRDFIALLGGAAAWPLAARAQQANGMRSIGMLMAYAETDQEGQTLVATFRKALATLGWEEGRNIRIEARWARGDTPHRDSSLRRSWSPSGPT
jgi:putative ABC transport system substrate-binding protein